MPYSVELPVKFRDLDLNERLSPSNLMRLFHESADSQMRDEGLSLEQIRRDGKAMILSRLVLVFHKCALQNDMLRLETWPVPARGFVMERCYRAFLGDEVVAQGESAWALVDLKTHRLLRHDQVDFSTFTHGDKLSLDADIAPYDGEYEQIGTHRVVYSDTDLNGHMNNARYLDLLCDCVPAIASRTPAALQIHYRNEAPMGSEITIMRAQQGDTFYVQTFCGGRPNIEGAIRFQK